MAENANHHYVPQFYFRQFNGGRRHICGFLRKDESVIPLAPVKGQCAKNMFYGTTDIEKAISQLEGSHANALRTLIETATTQDWTKWSHDHFVWLLHAVVFQHSRTLLEVEKSSPAMAALMLHWFKEWLKCKDPTDRPAQLIERIERGDFKLTENPTKAVLRQIRVAHECTPLLCDLKLAILRNYTDYPFVFSDSPAVFYNSCYRDITGRGVLGFQSPGLQIFLPLTPDMQLMLFDPASYTLKYCDGTFVSLMHRSDVSELNALQLHPSRQAIYFAEPSHAQYVRDLYAAHRVTLVKPEAKFRARTDLYVKDDPHPGEILHTYTPHLNCRLHSSFITYNPVSPRNYTFRHRSPDLVREHERLRSTAAAEESA